MKLVRYDAARKALSVATTIDDAKDIADKAEALRAYARQKKDVEMEFWLAEIKLRADRRIGEISRELEKSKGGNNPGATLPNGGKSKNQVLKAAGLSTSAANRCEQIAGIDEGVFESYISIQKEKQKPVTAKDIQTAVVRDKKEKEKKATLQQKPKKSIEGLHVGDFRDLSSSIKDESVELVFTDPPYDRKSIPLFEDAAKEAARILRPGGSMIAYCGQIQLPEVLQLMSKHLRYWWVNACVHSGGANQMHKYGIKNQWKPMVWFVKGTRGDVQTFIDDSVTGDREKSHHAWQQAESEARYYIEKLCSKNGIVVDFFAGGGTTLLAAKNLNRKWIGFEILEENAAAIIERLS